MDFETFNAGLNHGFEQETSLARVKPIAEALAKSDADVICVNEIYALDDIVLVREELEKTADWATAEVYVDYTKEEN